MPRASLIIVNYKTPKQTKLCLRSIQRYTRVSHETIVVDNRSGDASFDYLRRLSWIHLIENERPQPSHGNGLDAGIAHSRGEIIVILHTDTFVRKEGWLETLLGFMDHDTMIVGSPDRTILPINPGQRAALWWKRRKMSRQWKAWGQSPRIISHCALYRRELFTQHGQCFDHPQWVEGIYSDCGEVIQRYCEEKGLGIRLLNREQLEPLFWHFEGATLNTVTGRSLPFKRRFRTWRFYRRPEVCAILADASLDR